MPDLKYGSTGKAVKELQTLLNTTRYWHPGRKLEVDGQFGPLTAAAVQKCKYWLGYKQENIEPVAGELFIGYLSGKTPLQPEMAERRERRKQEKRPTPTDNLHARILATAVKDVGLTEGPNNDIKYNRWWCSGGNDGGAYCVRAGSYWAQKAGWNGPRWENTDALLADAKAGRRSVHLTGEPGEGVAFVIDFSGKSDPDHYGIFVRDLGGGSFKSLEANATLASGKQGVGYHERLYRNCWFIEREAS